MMSSLAADDGAETRPDPVLMPQTYWCHHCELSIQIPVTTGIPALCPYCHSHDNILEPMEMDLPSPPTDTVNAYNDNNSISFLLLDSPSFRRCFRHQFLSSSSSSSNHSESTESQSSIPTIKITSSLVESLEDSPLLCAVCKEEFAMDLDDVKLLPCNHFFHPHCITPWLSSHSTCPLCRFHLPTSTTPPIYTLLDEDDLLLYI